MHENSKMNKPSAKKMKTILKLHKEIISSSEETEKLLPGHTHKKS